MNNPYKTKHLSILMFGARHRGLQRRKNEDYYDVASVTLSLPDGTTDRIDVAIVADGVGSNPGGKEASQIAVQTIRNAIEHAWTTDIAQLLESAIQQANTALYHIAQRLPLLEKMATTIVVAAIWRGQLYVAHVGDSRAYLVRAGQAHRLTTDHTWVQGAIQRGEITYADALTHEKRHIITRCLGAHSTVEVDLTIDNEQLPSIALTKSEGAKNTSLTLLPGDSVLLCTDGLFNTVQDTTISTQVTRFSPKRAVTRLIALALAAGGPDNITVVTIKCASSQRHAKSWGIVFVAAVLLLGYLTLKNLPRYGLTTPRRLESVPSLLAAQAVQIETSTLAPPTATRIFPVGYGLLSTRPTVENTPTRLPIFTPTATRVILPTITPSPELVTAPPSPALPISPTVQVALSTSVTYTLLTATMVTETTSTETSTITGTIQPTATRPPWFDIVKPIDGNMDQSEIEIEGNLPQLAADECIDLVWWLDDSDQFRSFMPCQEIMRLIEQKQPIGVNLSGQFSQNVTYHYAFVIFNQIERGNSLTEINLVSNVYEFVYESKH